MEGGSVNTEATTSIEEILHRLAFGKQTQSTGKYKDGKLIIQIDLISLPVDGPDSIHIGSDLWCTVNFSGDEKKCAVKSLLFEVGKQLNFDVFEFYGPDIIEFNFEKSLSLGSELYCKFQMRMMDILFHQEKEMVNNSNTKSNHSPSYVHSFWGYQKVINLRGAKFRIKTRYIRFENCLVNEIKLNSPVNVSINKLNRGYSELHHVAALGSSQLMIEILDALARKSCLKSALGVRNSKSRTPLEVSIIAGNHRSVKVLLQYAGTWCFQDIKKTTQTTTPLHIAVTSSHFNSFSPCDWHELDLNLFTSDAHKCMNYMLRFLKKYHKSIEGWEMDDINMCDIVNWKDEQGKTPLMLASASGNATTIKLLLQYGADSNLIDVNANESCLQMATKSGKIDAVKALMNDLVPSEILNFPITEKILPLSAYKCNPTFIDDDGKSALEIAAETGNLDIFDYLLDSKIPYHNFDKYGNSCLHLASRKGYIEICQKILDAEKDRIIKEIETELGSAERMKSELERASSSFRGGIKTQCNCTKEAPIKISSLVTMQSRRAWLPSKNFQAKSASDLARDNGHLVLAGLIEKTCDEIYSQDFIDLQISHILQDKWGSSSSRSLSSLTAQIGSIRALFPAAIKSFARPPEPYDEASESASYDLALVKKGTLLADYEDSLREIIIVPPSNVQEEPTYEKKRISLVKKSSEKAITLKEADLVANIATVHIPNMPTPCVLES